MGLDCTHDVNGETYPSQSRFEHHVASVCYIVFFESLLSISIAEAKSAAGFHAWAD